MIKCASDRQQSLLPASNCVPLRLSAVLLLAFLFTPSPAHAHLVDSGFGAFYDGAIHFVISPEDVLVVLALSLLAGFSSAAHARALLYALPAAWLLGGGLSFLLPPLPALRILTSLSFGVAGLLLALNIKPSVRLFWLLVAPLGTLHGLANGVSLQEDPAHAVILLGIATSVFAGASLLSALVSTFRAYPLRIATRVAGSWIAAMSMLMLAWVVRGAN